MAQEEELLAVADRLGHLGHYGRDDATFEAAVRAVDAVARPLATKYCRSLAHRGGWCSGRDCECGAWDDLYNAVLARIAGKPSLRGRPRQQGLLELWAAQDPRPPFAIYVRSRTLRGWMTQLLRAWNSARGLRVRMRPSAELKRNGWNGAALALGSAGLMKEAEVFGLSGETFGGVLEALWWDACQPAPKKIDVARVGRQLKTPSSFSNTELGDEDLYQLGQVLDVIDLYLELQYPEWHSLYLGKPRLLTRPGSRYDDQLDYEKKVGGRRNTRD